jgi:long-chain acyl-CoA synthetase
MNLAARLLAGAVTGAGADEAQSSAALITPTVRWTRAELADRAARVAGAVAAAAAPDARVAILADNDEHFVAAYLGVLAAGRIAVPLNPSAPRAELAAELAAVGATTVLTGPGHETPAAAVVPVACADATAHEPVAIAERAPTDLAVLLFTSGTAGSPKAAMLTHGNLVANIDQVQSAPGLSIRAGDVGLGVLPFFHVYGLNVVIGLSLAAEAVLVAMPRFHPAGAVGAIREHGITVVAAVPAIYRAWLDLDEHDAPADSFASVRLAVSGAAALGTDTALRLRERFGLEVHDGYGLTEASPIVTTSAIGRALRAGSIGPPIPGVEVRLVDRDGDDVLPGDPGEIIVRGDNVFAGYWNDAEQTARVLRDGWLHTGDIAVADDDGWLSIVDRAKDLIIVSGFNVFPGEVETALVEHDDVDEAAVVGEPDERSGERVVAFVVARLGSQPTPTLLTAHLRRRLARYKIPARFEIVAELPHTFAGKVLRRALRDTARDDAVQKPA